MPVPTTPTFIGGMLCSLIPGSFLSVFFISAGAGFFLFFAPLSAIVPHSSNPFARVTSLYHFALFFGMRSSVSYSV